MISPLIFWVLVAVDAVLILYSFIDHDNRVYANVITAFLAFLLSGMLAFYALGGIVGENVPTVTEKIVNWSGSDSVTSYSYATTFTPMQDIALGYFIGFIAIAMFIVMMLFILDIRSELRDEREAGASADE